MGSYDTIVSWTFFPVLLLHFAIVLSLPHALVLTLILTHFPFSLSLHLAGRYERKDKIIHRETIEKRERGRERLIIIRLLPCLLKRSSPISHSHISHMPHLIPHMLCHAFAVEPTSFFFCSRSQLFTLMRSPFFMRYPDLRIWPSCRVALDEAHHA